MRTPAVRFRYEETKRYIEGGQAARPAGAKAAEHEAPAAAQEPSAYEIGAAHRADELARRSEEATQAELTELMSAQHVNPVLMPGEGPRAQCREVEDDRRQELEKLIQNTGTLIVSDRETVVSRGMAYRADLVRADKSEPRGGWMTGKRYVTTVALADAADATLAFGVLVNALGWLGGLANALFTVLLVSGVGAFTAWLSLGPADAARRGSPALLAKRAAAAAVAASAAAFLYYMMATRACLIDGKDASSSEVWERIRHPLQLIFGSGESLGLFVVGLIAFGVAAWETWKYYDGVEPALRRAGVAYEKALAALSARHGEAVAKAETIVQAGLARLAQLNAVRRRWTAAAAQFMDEATAIVARHNRNLEVIFSALRAVAVEFCAGYRHVRPQAEAPWTAPADPPEPLALPPAFGEARQQLVERAHDDAEAVRGAELTLVELRAEVTAMLDHLAGFAALSGPSHNGPNPAAPLRLRRAA